MKIRTGFVSNSSSSSFIVAYDRELPKVTVKVSLDSLIEHVLKTKEDLDSFFMEEYAYGEDSLEELLEGDSYYKENYEDMLKAIEAGKTVGVGTASNEDCDNPLGMYLYQRGFSDVEFEDDSVDLLAGDC